jgi:integrase
MFELIAYGCGLPPIRLHDLRHFAATLALAVGVDIKVVPGTVRALIARDHVRHVHHCAAGSRPSGR